MRVATVNVNGVRAALRKGFTDYLSALNADLVCLQEVRAPAEIVTANFGADWQIAQHVCEIKGRAGVAILSRLPMRDVRIGLATDTQTLTAPVHTGRWVEGTVESQLGEVRVVSVYVHSGTAGTPKMDEKYEFLEVMTARLAEIQQTYDLAVVVGDINIAHTNNDIKNWRGNLQTAGFLPAERAYLDNWFAAGWIDVHRRDVGDRPGPYTWWSQRGKAFDNDAGWRIDYQLVTSELGKRVQRVQVDRAPSYDTRWSDHAPLVVDYA